ncbi:Gfo/Idh/MocA family oxidoreductase, partial [bacterium]|nr:Gfo/Idh/MocA family oxidoreductase [bacterium]
MEEKIYKVGVIGTGGISRAHSNGYKAVKRTEIIAGADVSEEQLKKYGKEYGIDKFYTDYIEMVEAEKPDIVSICTWVNSHCEMVTRVAKLGIVKGILCEKPMALSMEEADQMVEACEKAGIKFAIGHQRRHAAQHQKTKELIDSNAIGDLVWLWGSSPPDLLDWGTHVADMMLFYAGEVEWLMGQIGGRNPEQHRRGYYHAHPAQGYMKFKNGA